MEAIDRFNKKDTKKNDKATLGPLALLLEIITYALSYAIQVNCLNDEDRKLGERESY